MSVSSIFLVISLFTLYPAVAFKLGPTTCFYMGQLGAPPMYLLLPYLSHLHTGSRGTVVAVGTVFVVAKLAGNFSFSSIAVLINQSVETQQRASVNGLSMTIGTSHILYGTSHVL